MIVDKNKYEEILANYSELQDGLFLFARQAQFALDTHVCRGVYGDDEFFVVVEYERKESAGFSECCNLSFIDDTDLKFSDYEETKVTIYTLQTEMLEHISSWINDYNHY